MPPEKCSKGVTDTGFLGETRYLSQWYKIHDMILAAYFTAPVNPSKVFNTI